MIARISTVLAAALALVPATAQAADEELWFRKNERVQLARRIQDGGFACPEVKAVYFLGARPDGNHMRAECGPRGGAFLARYRLTVRGSGTFRTEPWADAGAPVATALFSDAPALRTSLE